MRSVKHNTPHRVPNGEGLSSRTMIHSGDLLGSVYATDVARMGAPDSSGAFVNLALSTFRRSAGIRSVLARRPRYA